jgi:heparosan-N-sulfate-glucuronate 5-epimerase
VTLRYLRAYLKPFVMTVAPKQYYRHLIRQAIKEMNVNSPYIRPVIMVPYDSFGMYPTMYDRPPSFYEKRKSSMKWDENGIPMLNMDGTDVYHPVYMTQYALSEYGFFMTTNRDSHLETVKIISDWLVANQDVSTGYWIYSYDYVHEPTKFVLKAPWASAMAQGQAISLLTRLYRLTHIESYLEAAIRAVKMLDVPISNGGLASELWGHVVYEEFPTIPYSFTLNGFMFCALGLYDLSRLVKQEYIVNLWRKAVDTLTFMVPLYDGDFMSTYCLSHVTVRNATRKWAEPYHYIHIKMLQCFQSIIPNPTFEFYIRRWAGFWGIEIDG